MKQLSRDPNSRARAQKAEAKDSPISIKAPISLTPAAAAAAAASSSSSSAKKGGFKKGGFKNAFAPADDGVDGSRGGAAAAAVPTTTMTATTATTSDVVMEGTPEYHQTAGVDTEREKEREKDESDWEGEDMYDPKRPTGCHPGCEGWSG